MNIGMDAVTHFTCRRSSLMFIDRYLTKFDSKCCSGLTAFNGKAHLIIYCTEDRVRQDCQEDPTIES